MTHSTAGRVKVAGLQPAQVLAGLVGLAFLVLGVAGFLRTGVGDFAGDQHAMLLGFALNPLHNVIHLAFGVLGLLMATRSGTARLYGWLLFVAYGAVLLWGLALSGFVNADLVERAGNPLALNANDNWLHLGFAAIGLLIAVLPARRKIVVPVEETVAPDATVDPRYRDASIRDADTREMPTQRVGGVNQGVDRDVNRDVNVNRDERIESMDPTVSPRPVHPSDPAISEQHETRRSR